MRRYMCRVIACENLRNPLHQKDSQNDFAVEFVDGSGHHEWHTATLGVTPKDWAWKHGMAEL